jgi:putative aminopeptidase FrvX
MATDAKLLTHLQELSAAPGVSGYENPVREIIRAAWAPLADEIQTDRLGSLWAVKCGNGKTPRPKIMLAAHMDAIGLMVSQIEGEFLRVAPIGGIDSRIMPGQLVTVHGREDLPGVMAQPPAFLLPKPNREGVIPVTELLVDVGLSAEQLSSRVRVGDVISFAQPSFELQSELLSAKSLDNRASVAALTVCLEALQNRPHAWDVIAVATVQEEVGLQGAKTSAFALQPDLAIAVDVTFGAGANSKEFTDRVFSLGGGPVLGLGPNIHPGLHAALKTTAERAEIPYNVEPMPAHSGTDAFAIQVAREGVPTMVVSIPLRNMHTPVEVLALKDVARVGRLLAEFIADLNVDFMDTLNFD